ncbi:hypothetical protein G6O69_26465 [Pseudenhygromyxa sp. WMMC2535]|uniref:hypothetical protein n=1 Tax=Pseudenhygromyxa sp. WMMC2535 TaxID=2712867 RepID=UPI0015541C97|nr:hypothetical protein [Pseudenhygromyxa sp. WMMC2535]NVB41410.1 hypothetical protein [Pseudenhygromyxa sp. WMMC2535]
MDRLAMLEQLAKTKVDDPFPLYGLAMEYKKLGREADARARFEELHARHSSYVPAYLMHGNLLEAMSEAEAAAAVYARGVEVAQAAGDDHARSELQAALDALS